MTVLGTQSRVLNALRRGFRSTGVAFCGVEWPFLAIGTAECCTLPHNRLLDITCLENWVSRRNGTDSQGIFRN